MTATDTGRKAESAAADFLVDKEYRIIERNWRTRWCEIDIVAKRRGVIYFCEVKYRASNRQGQGFDYITAKKLSQMHFAAEYWVYQHGHDGDYELCAIEVAGSDFQITGAVTNL